MVAEHDESGQPLHQPADVPRARRLNFLPLIGVMWFIVCGGAFGLEPLVSSVGAGWAVALVLLTPLAWSLPIALMVAELASAMPEEGGYYVWVRRALGDFWGLQEGWWTVCYTAVDMAIYPVLFVNYLAYFHAPLQLPKDGNASWSVFLMRWLVAVLVIAAAFLLNSRGAHAVGRNATLNIMLVLLPFIILVVIGLARRGAASAVLSTVSHDLLNNRNAAFLAVGLSTVMWNYMGWDNTSTFAGEVNNPQRNYPRALAATLLLTIFAYLLPLLAGLSVTTDPAHWNESAGWPVIAQLMSGSWLGVFLAVAALVSAWSLFNSNLLYVSRLPYALARDGWLPRFMARVSEATGVPIAALATSCTIAAVFSALPFGKLVIIDVLLYSSALALEYVALIVLRRREPEMPRPFRVPGGWFGIALVTLAPVCCATVVLIASLTDKTADPRQALVVCGVIASGIVLYYARHRSVKERMKNYEQEAAAGSREAK